MKKFDLFIKDVSTNDGELIVESAYDRKPIGSVVTADSSAVEQALSTAHELFNDRSRWLSTEQRLGILRKAAEIMQSQKTNWRP